MAWGVKSFWFGVGVCWWTEVEVAESEAMLITWAMNCWVCCKLSGWRLILMDSR